METDVALKLVVYDLDGTLADTGADLADSVNELRKRTGLAPRPAARITAHVGQGVGHLLARTVPEVLRGRVEGDFRDSHPALYARFMAIYRRRCTRKTRLFPGALQVLRDLKAARVPQAVATNKPGAISRKILAALKCGRLLSRVVGGDEMKLRKPHPEVLHTLMKRFKAAPRQTLMVGDSAFDMECAKRAGVWTCAVTWGFGTGQELRKWKPDFTIRSFDRLPGVIAMLRADEDQSA